MSKLASNCLQEEKLSDRYYYESLNGTRSNPFDDVKSIETKRAFLSTPSFDDESFLLILRMFKTKKRTDEKDYQPRSCSRYRYAYRFV